MAPKRRARPSRSGDSVEIGPNGVVVVEQEPAKKPSPPPQEDEGDEVDGRDALLLLSRSPQPKRTKPSPEPARSSRPKGDGPAREATKPPLPSRRTWSADDEVRILEALSERQSPPDKAFYNSLLGLLDDNSCDRRELEDKVRSLRRRFVNDTRRGVVPSGDHDRRLYDLSNAVWGYMPTNAGAANQVENGDNMQAESSEQALPNAGTSLEEIHKRYPYLAQEVMGLEPAQREMFNMALLRMDGGKARALDARIKKFRLAKLKLEWQLGKRTKRLMADYSSIMDELTKTTIELLQ